MEYAETLRWTGRYLGLWLLAGIVSGAVVVAGIALGGFAAIGLYQFTPFALRIAYYPQVGVAVIGLGLLVFKFGSAAALVHVLVGATETRLPTALDTAALKSDILSVLDERLAEMHGEVTETRRLIARDVEEDDGFEFE